MRCTSPRTVGFRPDGRTLAWSDKTRSKEFASFQIPCSKCISCRLENARQTAVRCVHEASTYKKNCFITLTYSDENLRSSKLQYQDFQNFVKALRTARFDELQKGMFPHVDGRQTRRRLFNELPKERRKELYETVKIGVFCAGEYGDQKKRPHWHAIVFNWSPEDGVHKYTSDRGDKVYKSEILSNLWGHGTAEYGSVTFESAGYVARYASKKLYHGKDGTHDFEPISRRSSKNAIGKRWIEKNWKDCFLHGYLVFRKGEKYIQCGIPRYYEKWFKKNHPELWRKYLTEVKAQIIEKAVEQEEKILLHEKKENFRRAAEKGLAMKPMRTKKESENLILQQKFDKLKTHLKL